MEDEIKIITDGNVKLANISINRDDCRCIFQGLYALKFADIKKKNLETLISQFIIILDLLK